MWNLRCAACDSINEWIALNRECVSALVCVVLSRVELMHITQYCRCVCVHVWERDGVWRRRGGVGLLLANLSHSAATVIYTLIYHSTKKRALEKGREGWGGRRTAEQKIGADRDEARLHETKSEGRRWESQREEERCRGLRERWSRDERGLRENRSV